MKLVAFGILVAILGVGCALEAGNPSGGDPTGAGGAGSVVAQPGDHGFQLQPASTGGTPIAIPGQPEPSPWNQATAKPTPPKTDNFDPNETVAPEPAPWHSEIVNATTGANPSGGTAGNGGKSTSASAPTNTSLGHWDLKDVTSAN